MALDIDLPVWPFMPNWRDGILERLSWATIVMTSESGAEQRQSSRLSPRREFEATFNPVGRARTYFDLWLSELGGQEFMLPLWHDKHKITMQAFGGAAHIDCHTQYGEFVDGGMAIIVGADPWSHEVIQIETVLADGLDLAEAMTGDHHVGSVVLPLRRTRMDLAPTMTALTSRVAESQLRFMLNQANDIGDEGEWEGFEYGGIPVVTLSSNWSDGIDFNFSRVTEEEDNGTGIAYIRDIAQRAFRAKTHVWHLRGREMQYGFRQFLYRMGGRRSPVWMPTGNQDFVVTTAAAGGAGSLVVDKVGLGYIGGPKPGRDRVLAHTGEGFQVRRITGMGAAPDSDHERLNLDSNLTYQVPAGSKLQFVEIMRADGDDIEIKHHTDTEGMAECSINFRSFSDTRNPAGSNVVSYAVGSKNSFPCGTPGSPCAPTYSPWKYRVRFDFTTGGTINEGLDMNTGGSPTDVPSFVDGIVRLHKGGGIPPNFGEDYDFNDGGPHGSVVRDIADSNGDRAPLVVFRLVAGSGPANDPEDPTSIGAGGGGVKYYEWYFYFDIPEEDKFFIWTHQIGFGGTYPGHGTITVVDGNLALLASSYVAYGHLWPYTYSISW